MHDDVIIIGNFIRDVFELTKVQTKTNISQHLGKLACCLKDLPVLMTSSSFSRRQILKIFIFKNLTKIFSTCKKPRFYHLPIDF